jgi:hypothetical protein
VPRDVPGYHEAIRRPRCLEQIQRSLAKGKYAAPAQFLADMQLVWDNCREVGGWQWGGNGHLVAQYRHGVKLHIALPSLTCVALHCSCLYRLQYNEPDAPVYAEANAAEAYWQRCWAATGVHVSTRELSAQQTAQQAAAAAARAAAAAEKLESTWRTVARKVGV